MKIQDLYQLVLILVLVGMILGVGVLTIDKFQATTGITGNTANALGNTTAALAPISSNWLPLIVTVAVLAIILGLVIGSFSGQARR